MAKRKPKSVDLGRGRAAVLDELGLSDRPVAPPPEVTRGPEIPGIAHWQPKPVEPAPELSPEQKQQARKAANLQQSALGVSGTANLMGFLHDLGEANPDFQGLRAMQKYDLMRRTDGTVAALEAVIRLLVRKAEWTIEVGIDKDQPGFAKAKEIQQFAEDNLKGGMEKRTWAGTTRTQTFESVIENATLAAPYGCSGHEYLWAPDNDKNRIRLAGLAPRLPVTFYQFITEPDGETLQTLVQFGYRGAMVQMAPVPADKIDIFTLNREGAYFYGRSVYRPIWRAYYNKMQLIVIDCIGAERNRMAVPVIEQGPNATPEDVEKSWQWVENLSTNERMGFSIPFQWKFILQGIEGRAVDLTASIKLHDEEILVGGMADFMTLGRSASGSRALGDVKLEVFLLSEQAFANMIAETITNGAIRRLIDNNFDLKPDEKMLYPKLRCADITMLNAIDLVAAIKDLANSEVDWLQPTDEDENYVRRRLGIPGKQGIGRVKYAPIVERIQEMETGDEAIPSQSPQGTPDKGGKAIPQAEQGAPPKPQGDTQPGQTSHTLPSGRTVVPAKERARQAAAAKLRDSGSRIADAEIKPNRELKEFEKKHDFAAHVRRADTTAKQVARILRSAKPVAIRELARRASVADLQSLPHVSLPFDHQLSKRVDSSLAIARKFGSRQVYAERRKATGKSGSVKSKIQNGVALSDSSDTFFRAIATLSDFANEISKRVKARMIDLKKDGLDDAAAENQAADDVTSAPDGWIDRLGDEAGRGSVHDGRMDAMDDLQSEIQSYVRSEIMDQNTCDSCRDGDGTEWSSYDDIDWQPGDDCDGGDACRGQVIPVFADEGVVTLG